MMLRLLHNLLDKLIFTLSAIFGMQFPAFIQQYIQRLGGHLDEARSLLSGYQLIATQHFSGDIHRLIAAYARSDEPALRGTGELVQKLVERVDGLNQAWHALVNQPLWEQLYFLLGHYDLGILQSTWQSFQPALPLTTDALVCAAVVGLGASGSYHGLRFFILSLWRVKRRSKVEVS